MPKALSKQSQELVANVVGYFERELANNGPLIPLKAVRERAANALQISLATVHKISGKVARGEMLSSPKNVKRTKPKTSIDSFTETAIRNVINEMYANKLHVNAESILDILKSRAIFKGSLASLKRILHNIGFSCKQENKRRAAALLAGTKDAESGGNGLTADLKGGGCASSSNISKSPKKSYFSS